jgi:diguanylate cyclase
MSNDVQNNGNELSKKTLSELERCGIAPNPKCYEVMFEYIKGEHIEIKKAVDKFLDSGGHINEALLHKIYSSILSYDTIARTVDTVTTMLNAQIIGLNDSVSTSDEELSIFTTAIDSFSEHIDNTHESMNMGNGDNGDNNILTYMMAATERVKNKIKDLETELHYSQTEIKKLHNYLDNVCQDAMIDSLTSLATRKRLDQILLKSIRNSIETTEKLSVAFIEVDNYDAFKDKWGQVTSEQILRFIATSIKENIKGRDSAARYSESLFMVILPKTDSKGTSILAEHIRNMIERKRIIKKTTGEFLGRVTISVGIAEFQEGESLGYLMSRAERALSVARHNGKNCTVIEEEVKTHKNNFGDGNETVNKMANGN